MRVQKTSWQYLLILAFGSLLMPLQAAASERLPGSVRAKAQPGSVHFDCDEFGKSAGAASVIIADEGRAPGDPAVDVRLTFPRQYLLHPRMTEDVSEDGEEFRFNIIDSTAVDPRTLRDTNGRLFRPSQLPPTVVFLVHDRYEIGKAAAINIRSATGQALNWDAPSVTLSTASDGGLQEVLNARVGYQQKTRQFVVYNDEGSFSDLITCKNPGSVPYPHCNHLFDYRNLNIDGFYPLESLPYWKTIKSNFERFMACAYTSEIPVGENGSAKWE